MSINAVYEDSQGNVHESRMDGVDLTTKISIADDFSALVNYAVGDFCYHLGTLYKCTTAHTVGAWNAAHFTATQVGDEIGELKNTITTSMGNVKMTKLWENPDTTQAMPANTEISVNTAGYDFVMVTFLYTTAYPQFKDSAIFPHGSATILAMPSTDASSFVTRNIEYVSDTKYRSGVPYKAGVTMDNAAIPVTIYGIKII